eukprot:3753488-Alexandrium_andersonii.AAC.1
MAHCHMERPCWAAHPPTTTTRASSAPPHVCQESAAHAEPPVLTAAKANSRANAFGNDGFA